MTTRFPYRFADGGPTHHGIPVIFSRGLTFTAATSGPHTLDLDFATRLLIVRSPEGYSIAYTSDPDFEWRYYLAECREQASRIVCDGLAARLSWLKLGGPA